MKKNRLFAAILALFMLIMQLPAIAEDYVDLSQRFDDIVTYDFDGTTYYMNSRVTTTLVMCVNIAEEGAEAIGSIELMILVVSDDDKRMIYPIQLDPSMAAAWLEGEAGDMTLEQIFAGAANADEGGMKLVEAINGIFPAPVCEHYAMVDLRGLPLLDGIENTRRNTRGDELVKRLKDIKAAAEQAGMDSINDILDKLSGYVITDMKSGAMMKVVDKVDRFDRTSRIYFPIQMPTGEPDEVYIPDLEAFEITMLELYFTTERSW